MRLPRDATHAPPTSVLLCPFAPPERASPDAHKPARAAARAAVRRRLHRRAVAARHLAPLALGATRRSLHLAVHHQGDRRGWRRQQCG
eukprot:6904566-Prymnesium_polylepis.1